MRRNNDVRATYTAAGPQVVGIIVSFTLLFMTPVFKYLPKVSLSQRLNPTTRYMHS